MSVAEDLANLIVDHCNEEGRDVDAHEFAFRTSRCDAVESMEVFRALPLWAQRRVEATTAQLDAGMLGR